MSIKFAGLKCHALKLHTVIDLSGFFSIVKCLCYRRTLIGTRMAHISVNLIAKSMTSFQAHSVLCPACHASPTGICSVGYAILGSESGMRDDSRQLTLPIVTENVVFRPVINRAVLEKHPQMRQFNP